MLLNSTVTELGYDTTFELDDFGRPRLRSEGELVKNAVLSVVFSKPGNHPSTPLLGLDIEKMLYNFYDDIVEDDLRDLIIRQCTALAPYFESGQIMIRKTRFQGKPSLMIHVEMGSDDLLSSDELEDDLQRGDPDRYLIGITFDELNEMIYNISTEGGGS